MESYATTTGTWGPDSLKGDTVFAADEPKLLSFTNITPNLSRDSINGTSTDYFSDGIIAWGSWTSGLVVSSNQTLRTMSYVTGLLANNPTNMTFSKTYSVFASTAPVIVSTSGTIVATGLLNAVSGTLNLTFVTGGGGSISYNLSIPVAGQIFTATGTGDLIDVRPLFRSLSSTITSSGTGCTPSCTGNIPAYEAIVGLVTGTNAERTVPLMASRPALGIWAGRSSPSNR